MKIDLTDVTFLIPIRIDSQDRQENLETVLRYITKYYHTNIMVLEADKAPCFVMPPEIQDVEHWFIEDSNEVFFRTHYLNRMIKRAQTPIVSIYDADVILEPQSTLKLVNKIRNGEVKIGTAFNQGLVDVSQAYKQAFAQSIDIEFLQIHRKFFCSLYGRLAVGGALFMDRQNYWACGMENEHFRGWGPEDNERVKRMEKFGFPLHRTEGVCYHLTHGRGINSRYPSAEIQRTTLVELMKICRLDPTELKEYVNTWEWIKN